MGTPLFPLLVAAAAGNKRIFLSGTLGTPNVASARAFGEPSGTTASWSFFSSGAVQRTVAGFPEGNDPEVFNQDVEWILADYRDAPFVLDTYYIRYTHVGGSQAPDQPTMGTWIPLGGDLLNTSSVTLNANSTDDPQGVPVTSVVKVEISLSNDGTGIMEEGYYRLEAEWDA
jgi:hypothetical protein